MSNIENRTKTIVTAKPDWITITTATEEAARSISVWATREAGKDASPARPKRWRAMGYEGLQSPNIKVGVRGPGECIVMMPGEECINFANSMPIAAYKVTRFDLEVTVVLSEPYPALAMKEYARLDAINDQRDRKRYIKIIRSSTGDTLYVGRRTNAVMLRMYDKTASYEDGKLGLYWRYEVEFKKAAAQRAYDAFCEAKNKFIFAVSQVGTEFEKRGVDPRFPSRMRVSAIATKAEVSTDKGRIEWLAKCVAPVVTQLIYSGYEQEVLSALRLNNLLTIRKE